MTATTQDLLIPRRTGKVRSYPVAAGVVLFVGALVCLSGSGYAVDGTDNSGYLVLGLCEEAVDNTDGAAGDLTVLVRSGDEFLLTTGFTLTRSLLGDAVYLVDNATVGRIEDTTHAVYVGRLTEMESSSAGWVIVDPFLADVPSRSRLDELYQVQVAGVNATAFDLTTAAALYGGSDFSVTSVLAVQAFLASDKSPLGLKVVTTHYTVSGGDISAVGNETANLWVISFLGRLLN